MKKTLTVEGMMCPHCEARVKKALEALPQVDEAVVSHEAGTAIVTLNAEVDDEVLKKAVELSLIHILPHGKVHQYQQKAQRGDKPPL